MYDFESKKVTCYLKFVQNNADFCFNKHDNKHDFVFSSCFLFSKGVILHNFDCFAFS